ncbi:MAG: hypothetical protein H7334_09335 [Ferruginibacter sp.]|nr:hypothetical protein [Ferruginibacter sp.]
MAQTIFLIVAVLLSFLLYKAVLLVTKLFYKFYYKDAKPSGSNIMWQKLIAFLIAGGLLIGQVYSEFFVSQTHNYNVASIEKENNHYVITVFGERESMTHDPISFFEKNIYQDSIKLEVPQAAGIINGADVINKTAAFKYISGNITIHEKDMAMAHFYTDAYYKIYIASTWNGAYQLEWRK